jgi:hypothetical protein
MLKESRRNYKRGKYVTRKRLASFVNRKSSHTANARKMYGCDIGLNAEFAKATGCSISAMRQIVRKGEGAYYSSGSRPNQTAQSWGMARLASAMSSGKAAGVDFAIIDKGCNHSKRAYRMALRRRKDGNKTVRRKILL